MAPNTENTAKMGPWKTLASEYSFRDQWVAVRSDTVLLPNGQTLAPYQTVEGPDSVNIVALSKQGNIILVEQYRHPVNCSILEVPAGHVDPGELPLAAAQRELLEETGYNGGIWHRLGALFPLASRFSGKVFGFLAVDVVAGVAKHAHGEIISVREMPWETFADRIGTGEIVLPESNHMAMLFLALLFAKQSSDPSLARLRL
jgi:8-oxo-dGTP pyrophosphatase MutT (NUDIX family)